VAFTFAFAFMYCFDKKIKLFLWWKHTTFPGCNGLFIAFYFKLMIVYNKEQNEYLATRVI